MQPFGSAFTEIEKYNPNSSTVAKTIVVPPASRSAKIRNPALDEALAVLVDDELDLPRLGGSWYKGIANSALLQLWVGAGDEGKTQGTGLHCDMCNNFIVQLAGAKKWTFISPKHSSLMRPTMRRGKTAISGSDFTTKSEVLPYIPRLEATVYPGDFMYDLIHWCLASLVIVVKVLLDRARQRRRIDALEQRPRLRPPKSRMYHLHCRTSSGLGRSLAFLPGCRSSTFLIT